MIIRPFTAAMVDATDKLVMAAVNVPHSRKDSLRRHLDVQLDGLLSFFLLF